MSEACPLPFGREEDSAIPRMLAGQRIAVVGLSDDPSRASYGVAAYLKRVGKEIIPVNPSHEMVMGLRCYARLEDVPGPIDVVNVFRRPQFCPDVARSAVAVGAKGIWLQSGITSAEARAIAQQAGLDYVEDRCLKVEHMYSR
jgi:predicted CoA-binding protein